MTQPHTITSTQKWDALLQLLSQLCNELGNAGVKGGTIACIVLALPTPNHAIFDRAFIAIALGSGLMLLGLLFKILKYKLARKDSNKNQ